ncbi:MAG: outer membrane assembly protein [Tannerellaceae bacterium]|nr:outer membrane assembly protein [Tannerellaceae bacterium]
MKNKKFWIILVSVFVFILIGIPGIAFCILKWGVLPPDRLTPLVVNQANQVLNGELNCERIELTFFETYPRLGVRVYGGTLVSYATRDSASVAEDVFLSSDTLLTFNRALVSVNPLDYLFRDQLTIGGVFIEDPYIYAYVNEEGVANWDILPPDEEEVEGAATDSTTTIPPIDLQKLGIKGGYLVYDDRQADIYTQVDSLSVRMKGALKDSRNLMEIEASTTSVYFDSPANEMTTEVGDLAVHFRGALSGARSVMNVEVSSSSIKFNSPAYTLNNKMAIHFKSKVELTDELNTIRLEGAKMKVNELPFNADGTIVNLPDSNKLKLDLGMSLEASDLNELLNFVPDEYLQDRKNMQAKGTVEMKSKITGFLGDSIIPTINLGAKISNGSYFMKGVKQGIESLEMEMGMHLNGHAPDSSFVVLRNLTVEGLNTSFTLRARVDDLFRSPAIDTYMKGNIDFTRLAQEFLNPDTLILRGNMTADLAATFTLDDLMDGKYNRVNAAGKLDIDQLRAFSRVSGMGMYVGGLHFHVDSAKQTSSYLANEDLLSAYLTVDSMSIRFNQINTQMSGVDIQAKTSPVIDTTAVIPLTGQIKVGYLRSRTPDSVWVVAKNSHLRGGIKPSDSDKTMPNLAASITVDTLRYFDIPLRTGAVLAMNTFNIQALPLRDAMRQRRQAQQVQRATRERAQAQRQRSEGRQQGQRDSVQQSSGSFLRNWEVRGSVKFNQMRLFSRMFPLPMRMEQTSVRFDTDKITLTDAKFHAGKSNFVLTGELSSMRRAMMGRGKLQANFDIQSDYIDCNQLLQAMNRGMLYLEEKEQEENKEAMEDGTFAEMDESQLETTMTAATDTTDVLFVVPDFLDLVLKTRAKKIDFNDVMLENVDGELVVRNQSVNLKKLSMDSNIGQGNLTMVYTAKDRTKASAGFDLDMEDILVDRLIGLFPAIDSLLPMLRSFEGVVDCQMAATCELDSTMSVILPSVHAATYLHGVDMVLLDGETFSEISKTLMFKNKKRNLIDTISVDLLIKDEKIEVYPFLIEMDRYRVAVGGIHNLDLTFDYHLSVLKSPVPFKLGIDVYGDLDKFKFKIVKCRYKDIFKPAREAEMDATRLSLRTEIRDLIRKEMQANAPELANDLTFEQNFSQRHETRTAPRRQRPRIEPEETISKTE